MSVLVPWTDAGLNCQVSRHFLKWGGGGSVIVLFDIFAFGTYLHK